MVPSSEAVSRRMQRQRRRDTEPELELRRQLHAAGLRFRLGVRVPGFPRRTIDVAFPKQRVAVFVDGCFWHACPEHGTWPEANGGWWRGKLTGNVARDRETDAALRDAGWEVVRVWEHTEVAEARAVVTAAVDRRRASSL